MKLISSEQEKIIRYKIKSLFPNPYRIEQQICDKFSVFDIDEIEASKFDLVIEFIDSLIG